MVFRIESIKIQVPAKLYTGSGKYSTEIEINGYAGMISFLNPERQETLLAGIDCVIQLRKRGWLLTDFSVVDNQNSPPLWQYKLTLSKWDGDKLQQGLDAWQ